MGDRKTVKWKEIATLLENRGFPTIDHLMGGRYVPAVKAFFDREYNLIEGSVTAKLVKDGPEDWTSWNKKKSPRQA